MRVLQSIVLLSSIGVAVATPSSDTACHDCEIVDRDVAIIGGGSTGTYTAYRLQDRSYSIAVIEPKSYLGGHAETYTAPNGWTIDMGVLVFSNMTTVTDYFSRFNVSLVPLEYASYAPPRSVDFTTGQNVTDYTPPSVADRIIGLSNYGAQLAKYPNLQVGFNLTYPIPPDSDLLLPFGDFATKYNLTGAMPYIYRTNQGYTPLLNITTLYMLKYLNQEQLDSSQTSFLTTANHDIQELYRHVHNYLDRDGETNVFLNTTILAIDRSHTPIRILIQTPTGRKLVMARKLVITAPPTLSNLQNIPLSPTETSLFSQFTANGYYTGILTNTTIPPTFSVTNTGLDPSKFNLPRPGVYVINPNPGAPDHIQVYYGSANPLPDQQVKDDIVATVRRVQVAQGYGDSIPRWAAFSSHSPFNLMVSNAAICDRFYEKIFALQGKNNTFWNGAAWDTQDSSVLWKFTDRVLMPMIVAALEGEDDDNNGGGDGTEWREIV